MVKFRINDRGQQVSRAEPRVLHIGGNATDARRIREALTESSSEPFSVEWVCRLSDGLERLTTNRISAVLLDLQLPDCPGIDALEILLRAAPATPSPRRRQRTMIDEVARQVIRAGAHDYLLTNRLDSYWLPRALCHAIERKLSEDAFLAETERRRGHAQFHGRCPCSPRISRAVSPSQQHCGGVDGLACAPRRPAGRSRRCSRLSTAPHASPPHPTERPIPGNQTRTSSRTAC